MKPPSPLTYNPLPYHSTRQPGSACIHSEENMQQLSLHDLRWGSYSDARALVLHREVVGRRGWWGQWEVPVIAAEEVKEEDEEEEEDDDDDDDVFMVVGRKMGGGAPKAKDAKKKKKKTTTTKKRATRRKADRKAQCRRRRCGGCRVAALGYFINPAGTPFGAVAGRAAAAARELTPRLGGAAELRDVERGVTGLRPTVGRVDRTGTSKAFRSHRRGHGRERVLRQPVDGRVARLRGLRRAGGRGGGFLRTETANWFEHGTLEIDTGREMRRVKPHIPDELFFPTVLMTWVNATSVSTTEFSAAAAIPSPSATARQRSSLGR